MFIFYKQHLNILKLISRQSPVVKSIESVEAVFGLNITLGLEFLGTKLHEF